MRAVLPDRVETGSHWHEAELDFSGGRGRLVFRDLEPRRLRVSLENFLRVAFANLLVRSSACLVHAAAVIEEGTAVVFVGLSGSGKSGVAELSRPRPVLGDDLVALILETDRETDGGRDRLLAESTPFWGSAQVDRTALGRHPVGSLLHLDPAEEHALKDLPRGVQLADLRSCMPFLDPADPRALEVAERVLRVEPMRELRHARDAGFWRLLRGDG